jgi:hypothetical protein
MSELSFDSPLADNRPEMISEGSMADCAPVPVLPMPFDTDSREAEALRGAISFLFALITTYDEMIAASETTGEPARSEGAPH